MSVQIKTVSSKREMKIFARFANKLYKGNKYYVPSMPMDDLNTFDKEKNGAFDFSEAEFYLAYKDGEVVGRVAAIINHKANDSWNVKQVRYGWIDFIDDMEVSAALLDAVVDEAGRRLLVGHGHPATVQDLELLRVVKGVLVVFAGFGILFHGSFR